MLIKTFERRKSMFWKRRQRNQKEIKKFVLSDNAITFIKKFAQPELNITSPIDEDILDEITDLAVQWEMDMIDPLDKEGGDKTYDYPERVRNEMADKFVSEVTGQWDDDVLVPDFEDLNKKLGLI